MTKLNMQLPVSVFREGRHYIAYSPVLDLSTSGKNYEQVLKRFHEAVLLFFEEIIKKDAVEEVLMGLGWRRIKRQWKPPALIAQESQRFELAIK